MCIPVNQISYIECKSADLLYLTSNGNICTRTIDDLRLLLIFSPLFVFITVTHLSLKFDGNTFCFPGNSISTYWYGLDIIIPHIDATN